MCNGLNYWQSTLTLQNYEVEKWIHGIRLENTVNRAQIELTVAGSKKSTFRIIRLISARAMTLCEPVLCSYKLLLINRIDLLRGCLLPGNRDRRVTKELTRSATNGICDKEDLL